MIIHTDSTFDTDRYICIGSNHWNSLRNKLSLYKLEFSINAQWWRIHKYSISLHVIFNYGLLSNLWFKHKTCTKASTSCYSRTRATTTVIYWKINNWIYQIFQNNNDISIIKMARNKLTWSWSHHSRKHQQAWLLSPNSLNYCLRFEAQ
jgi:hypothetical protein